MERSTLKHQSELPTHKPEWIPATMDWPINSLLLNFHSLFYSSFATSHELVPRSLGLSFAGPAHLPFGYVRLRLVWSVWPVKNQLTEDPRPVTKGALLPIYGSDLIHWPISDRFFVVARVLAQFCHSFCVSNQHTFSGGSQQLGS